MNAAGAADVQGVVVLDVTTIVLGPYATQMLADLGARVIKIETPGGDLARAAAPVDGVGRGAMYVNNNRNKETLALDLKSEAGAEAMRRLVRRADCLVHNMRPSAIARLGFDFAACAALNPSIIYCAAVGFGSEGPYAGRPAFDDIMQAAAGFAGLPAELGDPPAYVASTIADKVTALFTTQAVLAALCARARDRRAIEIEVPMFESVASFLLNEHLCAATFSAEGRPGYHRVFSRNRRPYRTRDGWIGVLPYTADQWRRLLDEIGRSDLAAQAWFGDDVARNRRLDELYAVLADAMPARTTEEWQDALERLDVPHAPVNTLSDLLSDPHLEAVGFFASPGPDTVRALPYPVKYRGRDTGPDRGARALGADSAAILAELGYGSAEIAAMAQSGAVVVAEGAPGRG